MRWLLALSGLLSLSGSVLAGSWKLDSSCASSKYKHDATDGMHDAFTLASQLRGALDKLADKKPLATRELSKKDAEIHKVLGYIFLTGKEKLDEKTDFGPLRRRLKAISGSSKRDDKADPGPSSIISYCDAKRMQKIQYGDEKPRWYDSEFERVVTYDPEEACKGKSQAYVINGQQPSKEVNQLQMCPGFLQDHFDRTPGSCNKWCWKKHAEELKGKDPAPVDMLDEFPTKLFFALLFTTTKDTEGTACKTKQKRAEEADDYKADDYTEHVKGNRAWLEITLSGWRGLRKGRIPGAQKRDGKTAMKDPSAAAHAARAIDMILNQGLTVDEDGNVIPLEQ